MKSKYTPLIIVVSAIITAIPAWQFHQQLNRETSPEPLGRRIEVLMPPTPIPRREITPAPEKEADPMIKLVNQERVKAKLPPLKHSEVLDKTAKAKACDMVENKYFSHTNKKGEYSWGLFEEMGYQYEKAGENLARDFKTDGEAMREFMNSKTHRDNILDKNFTEIGIGRCGQYIAQHFGLPR